MTYLMIYLLGISYSAFLDTCATHISSRTNYMNVQSTIHSCLTATGLLIASASGSIIYTADFSNPGEGSTHDDEGDGFETSPLSGTNWELSFGSLETDGTTNEFITVGGVMRVQDWGGSGTITSNPIPIASDGTVDIAGTALAIASGDAFNVAGEGITWFYTLNASTTSSALIGNGTAVNETDISNSFNSVAVSSGDTLLVGFTVDVDGLSDGAEISSLTVDFTPIPEPTTALLASLGLLALFRRRRAK